MTISTGGFTRQVVFKQSREANAQAWKDTLERWFCIQVLDGAQVLLNEAMASQHYRGHNIELGMEYDTMRTAGALLFGALSPADLDRTVSEDGQVWIDSIALMRATDWHAIEEFILRGHIFELGEMNKKGKLERSSPFRLEKG